jgi:uncharacterized protein YyaL (SSP411 family)
MKDAQVRVKMLQPLHLLSYCVLQDGAEPSAVSITLYNLNRLSHFAEDRHSDYQAKAQSILRSNSQLLEHAPYALATMVSAAMVAQRGYKQVTSSSNAVT